MSLCNVVLLTLVVTVAIGIGVLVMQEKGDPNKGDIKVITTSEELEKHLVEYKSLLGSDYEGYRGHLYRVLTYTMHFLNGDKTYQPLVEAALVFHDIGLWTDSVLDYLDPSFERFKEHFGDLYTEEELQLAHDIIIFHHKVTSFEGPHADVVNAVRKADWIDATQGLVHHGMSKDNIAMVYEAIPAQGFYDTLLGFGSRLHGYNVFKAIWELKKIFYF